MSSSDEESRCTPSGIGLRPVYTPDDVTGVDYARDLGEPAQYPFTRGLYATGYRKFS